jgi:hypothetical protein
MYQCYACLGAYNKSLLGAERSRTAHVSNQALLVVSMPMHCCCCGFCCAAYNPYILGAANVFFCLVLVPFSMGQFRLVVVLALLTFASVTLCQYAGCCGAVGSVTYLVGRILATGGDVVVWCRLRLLDD